MNVKNKQPQRTCIGCGQEKDKKELIRVVRTPEGEIKADFTGRMNGRGAYLCRSQECLARALKNHGLERAFKMPIPAEVQQKLREDLNGI